MGLCTGGSPQAKRRQFDYITLASGGNATEFKMIYTGRSVAVYGSSTGTTTRGFYFGGFAPDGSIDAVNSNSF